MKSSLILTAAFCVSSTLAFANPPAGTTIPQGADAGGFQFLDANKDGFLSTTEATFQGLSENKFVAWDSNRDNRLSEQEFVSGIEGRTDANSYKNTTAR